MKCFGVRGAIQSDFQKIPLAPPHQHLLMTRRLPGDPAASRGTHCCGYGDPGAQRPVAVDRCSGVWTGGGPFPSQFLVAVVRGAATRVSRGDSPLPAAEFECEAEPQPTALTGSLLILEVKVQDGRVWGRPQQMCHFRAQTLRGLVPMAQWVPAPGFRAALSELESHRGHL